MCPVYSLASEMTAYSRLLAKEAREKWEKCFNDAYIQPTLKVRRKSYHFTNTLFVFSDIQQLDKSLREATQLLLNDKKEG